MNYLIATSSDGITNCGDPIPTLRSPFGVLSDSIRLEAEHDAANLGEDPNSPAVKLDAANRIASERISLFIESTGQTQGAVAAQLRISRGYLNRVINGKAAITYDAYERLFEAEQVYSILEWIDRTATPDQQARFETMIAGVRIRDGFPRVLYCMASIFGAGAWQDWQDSNGTLTPIPAEADAPEALSAAMRKGEA